MKKKTEIIKWIIWIVITSFICLGVSKLLENKESERRLRDFFEEEQDIDVFFLGSSHVRHGFFPMELWRDYGIVSYNIAGNGDTIPVSYWKLNMALDYKTPKLVVFDIYDLWPGNKTSDLGIGQVHTSMDAFPLSIKKVNAVVDLFDSLNDRLEMLFKIAIYHSRWSELKREDFDYTYSLSDYKGSSPLLAMVHRELESNKTPSEKGQYDTLSREYLYKIIDLCRDNNIQLLLINTGYDAAGDIELFAESIDSIAEENSLNYIDFTKIDVINFDTDLQSTGVNTHTNLSGSRKLTKYIGEYIEENYDCVPNNLTNSMYEKWNEDYEEYLIFKSKYINNMNSLKLLLLTLSDEDFSVDIYVYKDSIYNDEDIVNLIDNIKKCTDLTVHACNQSDLDKECDAKIVVKNKKNNEVISETFWINDEKVSN